MSRKLIKAFCEGQRRAKVYRDSDWQEWRVTFYIHAEKQEGADYHTTDKAEALETAQSFVSVKIGV